eukprot:COSAG06_NODE_224_length_19789_cov_2569.875622_6_plen_351_part_00
MSSRTPGRSPLSAKKRRQRDTREANLRAAVKAREDVDADRAETRRQLDQARRDQARFLRELKLSRRAFQSDAMNATVVGAAIPQNVDDFGTETGIDLTQVGAQSSGTQTSPSIVQVQGARAALHSALQGPSIGGDDTTVLANQIRSPAVSRALDFDQSAIAGTPGTPLQNLDDFTLGDITPPPGATTEGFSPGIQALAGFVQQAGVELDNTDVPMGAADVHGAALDAVGDPGTGAAAAVGLGGDEEAHMDDYAGAYEELGGIIGALLAGDDDEDFDLVESDESDDEAPTTTSTGVQATPASGEIDAIRRRKAVQMLRKSPGLIKLIQAGECCDWADNSDDEECTTSTMYT